MSGLGANPLQEDDDDQERRTWAKDPPCSCSERVTITLPLFVFAHFFSTTFAFSVLNQPIAAHGRLISQLDSVRLILTANKWEMGLPCSRLMCDTPLHPFDPSRRGYGLACRLST